MYFSVVVQNKMSAAVRYQTILIAHTSRNLSSLKVAGIKNEFSGNQSSQTTCTKSQPRKGVAEGMNAVLTEGTKKGGR